MDNEEKATPESGAETKAETESQSESKAEPKSKKGVEEKLDDFSERFARSMTDGVKRMEEAFEKGIQNIRDNPNVSGGKVRGFFTSASGGAVLIVIGVIWFFYAVNLLDNPIFPILLVVLGFYLMRRYRDK